MQRTFYYDKRPAEDDVTFVRGGPASVPGFTTWNGEAPLPNFPGGSFGERGTPSLTNIRLLGQEMIDGKPHWIVGFEGEESGIDTIRYFSVRAWINAETYLIRRLEDTTTRGEGCCGAPEIGLNSMSEYTDYEIGPYELPTPLPSETPESRPPVLTLDPPSGPCNGDVTIRGSDLQPGATVSAEAWVRFFSTRGAISGGELSSPLLSPQASVDDRGELRATIQMADDWCTSPDVAIGEKIAILVLLRGGIDYSHHLQLQYMVAPCQPLPELTLTSPKLCFNTSPALTPPAPTP
jgi:hypothetical protein